MRAIQHCRTSSLGGHIDQCDACGYLRISYNSCRNRHCPKCQNTQREAWIENRKLDLLPVPYFHVVFTVPDKLNRLFILHHADLYNLLFASAWETLAQFSYTQLHAETGMVAVLHTWGQNLTLHPHIHCIVPAAGFTLDGQWKKIGHLGNYLYPVHQLSEAFKGRFLDSLKRALRKQNELSLFNDLVQRAFHTRWIVNCEPSLASADHVVKYLGQYTHRVAITNQRILIIAGGKVTFMTKDYRDGAVKKPVTLDGVEFLRRFTLHILPSRFVKIRYYGIYNHTAKRNLGLQFVPEEKPDIDTLIKHEEPPETALQRFERLTGVNPCQCPVCKTGRMVAVRELPRIRAPDCFFHQGQFPVLT